MSELWHEAPENDGGYAGSVPDELSWREGVVDWSILVLAAAIVLGAAIISGITGFGFGLISVPPLLMFFDPAGVLTITKVLTISTSWIVIASAWRELQPRLLLKLLPFSIIGIALGLQVLRVASAEMIKIAASVIVVSFALMLLRGIPEREFNHPMLGPLAGLISGAMSTSTALSGPPIILWFTVSKVPVQAFRATIAAYFVLLDLFGLPALIRGDFVTRHDLRIAVLLIPAAFIGRWVGSRLSHRFSRERFYRFTLTILIATGLLGIAGAAVALIA